MRSFIRQQLMRILCSQVVTCACAATFPIGDRGAVRLQNPLSDRQAEAGAIAALSVHGRCRRTSPVECGFR